MKPTLPLYNQIGPSYNSTRTADLLISEKLFEYLEGEKDGLYLDIGCGTGNYTIALANKGLNLIGVEPSEVMLSEARLESSSISWLQGRQEIFLRYLLYPWSYCNAYNSPLGKPLFRVS